MSLGIQTSRIRRVAHKSTIIDGLPVIPVSGVGHIILAGQSIQSVINGAVAGDAIFLSEGTYNETVTVNKRLTIVGLGGRGAAYIEPTTAGAEGMQVTASDVTLINVGVASDDTGDYALNVKGNSTTKLGKRFRAFGCKFEGGSGASSVAVLFDGDANYNASDALLEDCEIAWANKGIVFDDSLYGFPTQIFIDKCRFHNLTTEHIGLAAAGGVVNVHITDCLFDNDEAGTAPTNYIKLNRSGDTGLVSGCRFALATNNNKNVIAAGILWSANATEAGWSTARPTP